MFKIKLNIKEKDLFDLSIDDGYYKPIITKGACNNNYIQYKSRGDEGKNLSIEEYLDIIKPYLNDIINDHKTQEKWRIHSSNRIMKCKTQNEWKIQLTMAINFISSKDSDETRTMRAKGNNVEIMKLFNLWMKLLRNFLSFFCRDIKKD